MARVALKIGELPGAEISPGLTKGKCIVLLETASENEISAQITYINKLEGVLSTALVYHHFEPLEMMQQEIHQ